MIHLSNGVQFAFQCASGALAFDGRGWPWEHPLRWLGVINPKEFIIVAKTVTLKPRKGRLSLWHPWTCIRLLPGGGVVNAVGLTNPGIVHWVEVDYPRAKKEGYIIAPSIECSDPSEASQIGNYLDKLDIPFIELNVSCPNINEKITDSTVISVAEEISRVSSHPIILKLSYTQAMNVRLLQDLNCISQIEALHAINAVPWDIIYPDKTSPLERLTGVKGAVSGTPIHNLACNAVRLVSEIAPSKQVIGGGGITSIKDIINFTNAGALGYSFGTVFIRKPWRPNIIMKHLSKIIP